LRPVLTGWFSEFATRDRTDATEQVSYGRGPAQIGHTRTAAGLRVKAKLDTRRYPTGRVVTRARKIAIQAASTYRGSLACCLQPARPASFKSQTLGFAITTVPIRCVSRTCVRLRPR